MQTAQFDGDKWVKIIHIPKRPYYTVSQTATILGTGVAAIYHKIERSTFKAYRVEGVLMVKHEDLMEYVRRREALANYDFTDFSIETVK